MFLFIYIRGTLGKLFFRICSSSRARQLRQSFFELWGHVILIKRPSWKVISTNLIWQRFHYSLYHKNTLFYWPWMCWKGSYLNLRWCRCGSKALTAFLIWRDTCYLGVPASLKISDSRLSKVGHFWCQVEAVKGLKNVQPFYLCQKLFANPRPTEGQALCSHFFQISLTPQCHNRNYNIINDATKSM